MQASSPGLFFLDKQTGFYCKLLNAYSFLLCMTLSMFVRGKKKKKSILFEFGMQIAMIH